MTFEEWFEQRFPPVSSHMNLVRESYREIARAAWEAGYDQGVEDYGYFPEAELELAGRYC